MSAPLILTLRLRPSVASALDAEARRAGLDRTQLAHRLIATALPGIPAAELDPRPGGRPRSPRDDA